jgi:peptidoglycan/LPS O-acetylase OafA/YrhL
MFFYLIFSFALLRYRNRVAIAGTSICLLVLLGAVIPHRGLVFDFYTRVIMLEFVFGMLLATAYLRGLPKLPPPLLLMMILGSAAVMALRPNVAEGQNAIRGFFWGLPALVIVASGLMLEGRVPKTGGALLQKLGDASYTIYLSHPFTVAISRVIFTRLGLRPSTIPGEMLFIALAVGMAAILGCIAYQLIEVSLIRASKNILVRERPKPALVSA